MDSLYEHSLIGIRDVLAINSNPSRPYYIRKVNKNKKKNKINCFLKIFTILIVTGGFEFQKHRYFFFLFGF